MCPRASGDWGDGGLGVKRLHLFTSRSMSAGEMERVERVTDLWATLAASSVNACTRSRSIAQKSSAGLGGVMEDECHAHCCRQLRRRAARNRVAGNAAWVVNLDLEPDHVIAARRIKPRDAFPSTSGRQSLMDWPSTLGAGR